MTKLIKQSSGITLGEELRMWNLTKTGGTRLDEIDRKLNSLILRVEHLENEEHALFLVEKANRYEPDTYVYNSNRICNPKDKNWISWSLTEFEYTQLPRIIANFHEKKCKKGRVSL